MMCSMVQGFYSRGLNSAWLVFRSPLTIGFEHNDLNIFGSYVPHKSNAAVYRRAA